MKKSISLLFLIFILHSYAAPILGQEVNPAFSKSSQYKEASYNSRNKNESPSVWFSFKKELPQGIWHIFTGLDHIAFVIALALILYKLKTLVQVITFFTIAHAITLTLYSLNILKLGKLGISITEIMVAVSIAWVGIENLLLGNSITDATQVSKKFRWRRSWIAFGFGLVHGIAFSEHFRNTLVNYDPSKFVDVLKLLLTVLFFNIGVDIGQLFFVVATFLILHVIRTKVNPHNFAIQIHEKIVFYASTGVAALGLLWTLERSYKTFFR